MKVGLSHACLSAAVLAVLCSDSALRAVDLTWDPTGSSAPAGSDGSGTWNTSNLFWAGASGNVSWNNANLDNAILGTGVVTGTGGTIYTVTLGEDIAVQNLTFNSAANGAYYNLTDKFDNLQTLTLAGNVTKASSLGGSQILLNNPVNLTSAIHTFAINDTGGDAAPELTVNSSLAGSGAVTLNNGTYASWGTLAFNVANTYAGATNIDKGRLSITDSGALGSTAAGTTIGAKGTLSFGASGVPTNGNLNIAEAITIKRDTYTGTDFSEYADAIIASNIGGQHTDTLSGQLTIDSTDARIRADTNRIIITSNIAEGPTVAPGTGVLTLDGDFAGFVSLTGNNSAIATGGIKLIGGVELDVTNQNNLGGANSKLTFAGSATLHPIGGFMTDFGTHVVNTTTFSGGIDIDPGQHFDVSGLSGVSIGKRGTGTLNLNGTNTFTGTPFYDAGIVNVNGDTTFGGFRLRSPTVYVNNGATLTTTSGISDIGSDTPDSGTVNVIGNGKLNLASFDFFVGHNAGIATAVTTGVLNVQDTAAVTALGDQYYGSSAFTSGTLNLSGNATYTNGTPTAFRALRIGNGNATAKGFANVSDNAILNSYGELYVGRAGGVGVLTQSGGAINANQGGGNSFVVGGDAASTGTFTKTGGTTTVTGETWIGNGTGTGTMTQSAGMFVANDYFVVGRNGALGTLDVSGGFITRQNNGGHESYVGQGTQQNSKLTVRGTGAVSFNAGEFWLGNAGSSKGTLALADTGAFTANSWVAVGRNGTAQGVITVADNATLTKNGSYVLGSGGSAFTIGSGGGATGTVTQTGGTITSAGTFVGENGIGSLTMSAGIGNYTNAFAVGTSGSGNGTLTLSGTAALNAPIVTVGYSNTAIGTVNLNGGTLTATAINGGTSTAAKTLNLNGTSVVAAADTTTFISGLSAANVRAGGAKINSNGHAITISQALIHEAALGATADGGLTKSGAGVLSSTAFNTYTGATNVTGGELRLTRGLLGSALSVSANAQTTVLANGVGVNTGTSDLPTLTLAGGSAPTATFDIGDNAAVIRNGVFSTTVAQVRQSFENGGNFDWGGKGITSATARTRVLTGDGATGVGVVSNDDLGYTSFKGVNGLSGTANEVLLKYTYLGDTDLNGTVDGDDYSGFLAGLAAGAGNARWVLGDFDYNGTVNGDDFSAFLSGLNAYQGGGTLAISTASESLLFSEAKAGALTFSQLSSVVPEPSGIAVLTILGAGALRRRRGKGNA